METEPEEKLSRVERHKQQKQKSSKSRAVLGWVIAIAVAVAVAFLIRAFVFEIIMVDGPSMQPTLHTNERLAVEKVTRYGGLPQRGEIVIVHYPNGTNNNYVKRVIGLPGETVEVKNSVVYINGQPLSEDYVSSEAYADMGAVTVPENSVFVMGDNRANSEDSRYVGAIARDQIVGHAMAVIWPIGEWRGLN